jgi:HlyD family secretion protein
VAGWWWYDQNYGGRPIEVIPAQLGPVAEYLERRGETRLEQTYLVSLPYPGRIDPATLQQLAEGTPVRAGQTIATMQTDEEQKQLAAAEARIATLEAELAENNDTSIESTTLAQTQKIVESGEQTVQAAGTQVERNEEKQAFAKRRFERQQRLQERGAATDETLEQAELALVEATVEAQQARLSLQAITAIQVATELLPVVVRQQIDKKALSAAVLRQRIAEAEAQREVVRLDLERAKLTSPVDGVILARHVTNERELAAGEVLVEIGQPDSLEVEADFLSTDVVKMQVGDPATFSGPAIGPEPVAGRVERIFPSGFTKVSSLGVEEQRVKVVLEFAPGVLARLRSSREFGVGYRVLVRVFPRDRFDESAIIVPRSAVFRDAIGGWQLFVVRAGRVELQNVELGLMNDERVQILKGLAADEPVVLAPEASLTPGARVQPVVRNLSELPPQPLPISATEPEKPAAETAVAR